MISQNFYFKLNKILTCQNYIQCMNLSYYLSINYFIILTFIHLYFYINSKQEKNLSNTKHVIHIFFQFFDNSFIFIKLFKNKHSNL